MSDTLSLDVRAALAWLRQESLSLSTIADAARLEYTATLSPGTEAAEVDVLWHDAIVLAAAAQQDLDLTALTTTLFGGVVAVSFAAVKALLIVNTAGTDGEDLLVGGAGAAGHAWAEPMNGDQDAKLVVPADSSILLVNKLAGWPVTGGTDDVLRIQNNGSGNITARIVIVGTSE